MRFRRCWLWLLALFICSPVGCSSSSHPTPTSSGREPIVRVRIMPNLAQATISASEAPLVRLATEREPRKLNLTGGDVTLALIKGGGGWQLGTASLGPGELIIQPAADGTVSVNGKAYRGRYRFVPVGNGQFDVINDVDVDGYLKSVVPREMFREWDVQAYKAQAIAARTYALYVAATTPKTQPWDLFADVRSQVYGGMASESSKSRQSVDETAGVVAAFGPGGDEKIFKAYFSSCCGGITQSAWDASGDAYSQPLSAQSRGPVCNAGPRFNWGPIVVRKDELTKRFRAWGKRMGRPEQGMATVNHGRASRQNRHGGPVRFEITDARGNRYSWRGEELRWAVNTDAAKGTTLNSSFCKIDDAGDMVRFYEGHGYGHGVGMCQWCCQARALAGWAHEDIVLRAYPGAKLVKAY